MSIAPTPARIRLPELAHPPATILEFLCARFPHIGPEVWRERIAAGKVRSAPDEFVAAHTAYQPGITITYFREVAAEVKIPFPESVIYEDERLLVADKPHFLPVTPAGDAVNECLLFRLQRRTGAMDLAPVHRLDRDTAGLVLFAKHQADRARSAQFFATGKVERKYLAIARIGDARGDGPREWLVENRIAAEPGSFRMRVVPGEVNARTRIELKDVREGWGYFELFPLTGKKHQLRIHMMALGFPILNDPFYPEIVRAGAGDFTRPLQLLASELALADPVTGVRLHFESGQRLGQ